MEMWEFPLTNMEWVYWKTDWIGASVKNDFESLFCRECCEGVTKCTREMRVCYGGVLSL